MDSGTAIHVGTSGWTYDDWQGAFYPEGVRGTRRLAWYATVFDTVEVNASFYRYPGPAAIRAWNRLPARFHLVLKGSRRVTHFRRLRDCTGELEAFLDRALALERLRVLLWQLPPSLAPDPSLLEDFLGLLPRGVRHAVEFRHPGWWRCPEAETILARHGVAFVAVSHPRLPATVLPVADLLYVRFHGTRRLYDHDYSPQQLAGWVRRLRPHLPGRTLYAFFNNDVAARAPANALAFRRMLERLLAAATGS